VPGEGGAGGNGLADGAPGGAGGAPSTAEVEGLVRTLAAIMRADGITELDIAYGAVSVRLRGGRAAAAPVEAAVLPPPVDLAEPEESAGGHLITAPMIGTFYTSPSPGTPPFVEVGDRVEAGQTIGIIEAMKILNEIAADRAGVVAALLVGNGQPVEYGSPLVRLAAGDPA